MAQVPDTNNYKMLSQQRQEKPESRGPKAPEKQLNTERYSLKLTCTGYSQGAQSRKGKGPPSPNTREAQIRRPGAAPALGEGGEQLDSCPVVSQGKILSKPRSIEKSLHSKPTKGLPGQPENTGEGAVLTTRLGPRGTVQLQRGSCKQAW